MTNNFDSIDLGEIEKRLANTGLSSQAITYNCELITPLIVGAVDNAKISETTNFVRASSIRGRLRYWLRYMHNLNLINLGKYQNLYELESEIFGTIHDEAKSSLFNISTQVTSTPELKPWKKTNKDYFDSYKGKNPQWSSYLLSAYIKNAPFYIEKMTFDISIEPSKRYISEQHSELFCILKECFRWFASFDGIGMRCRRGLGSFKVNSVKGISSFSTLSRDEIQNSRCKFTIKEKSFTDPVKCLEFTVDKYRLFRQDRNGAQGRSCWPEADSIRRLYVENANKHDSKHKIKHPALIDNNKTYFPRALFGLPIRFQFTVKKNENDNIVNYDSIIGGPVNAITINPWSKKDEGLERYSSPLRFCALKEGDKYFPLILLDIKSLSDFVENNRLQVTKKSEEAKIVDLVSCVKNLNKNYIIDGAANPEIIKAFFNYFEGP